MHCYWVNDQEAGRVHIPGCWSAVLDGPKSCTCRSTGKSNMLAQKVVELEERIAKLEKLRYSLGE